MHDLVLSITYIYTDKFWSSKQIKDDWMADVAGTGTVSLNL